MGKVRIILPLLLLYMACGAALAGGFLGKLSPHARRAVVWPGAASGARQAGDGPWLVAFVQLADGGEAELLRHGCRLLDRRGDIAIASLPRRRLAALAASPSVRRIEAGAPCGLAMDTTALVANVAAARQGQGLPQAYTGEGVVVGVMDVGFDLTHPNFLSPDGSTLRVAALWDQLSADTVGSALPVGRDYVGAPALLAAAHSADGYIETHGTHTTGIAAGAGHGSPYVGVAPAAELCLVANAVTSNAVLIDTADYYKYTTATDALGFKYIFDHAAAQGKPCVASFSEGYSPSFDGEDSLFRAYLAGLTGPGRIIVSAAGNESRASAGTYVAKPAGVAAAGAFLSGSKSVSMLVRGTGEHSLRLVSYALPGRDSLVVPVSALPLDTALTFPFVSQAGDTLCTLTARRYVPALADRTPLCRVRVSSPSSLYARRLAFVLHGGGEAEAMSLSGASLFYSAPSLDERWNAAASSHNLLAPACFPEVIAVGATTHRTSFTNYLGQLHALSQDSLDAGGLAYYSSRGPAIDGATKPDVAAPGTNVVSSYSSFYIERNPTASDVASDVAHFDHHGRTYAWNSNAGTSMACPVVAGVVALWLEACPTLTPSDVVELMARTCSHPDATLAYPNNLYGHGLIDAHRGLLSLLGLDGVRGLSASRPGAVGVEVRGRTLRICFRGDAPAALSVAVYGMGGAKAYAAEVATGGRGSVEVELPPLAAGVYAVQTSAGAAGATGSTLVRLR